MPAKVTGTPEGFREVDRWAGGVGWTPHPEEVMERTSHAVVTDSGVWLVDPLEAPGVDDLIAELGEVAGVVLLSNYHRRDADVFADRYDVPVTVPTSMSGVAERLAAPTERLPAGGRIDGYELLVVARQVGWQEYALYDGETLIVGESVGGADYMRVEDERLGVMLLRRLIPPRDALGDLEPERVFSGHGPGVQEDATAALQEALRTSRRRFPRALLAHGGSQVRSVLAALRT